MAEKQIPRVLFSQTTSTSLSIKMKDKQYSFFGQNSYKDQFLKDVRHDGLATVDVTRAIKMSSDSDVDDMVLIGDLTESSIMENLKKRYARTQIYVS